LIGQNKKKCKAEKASCNIDDRFSGFQIINDRFLSQKDEFIDQSMLALKTKY